MLSIKYNKIHKLDCKKIMYLDLDIKIIKNLLYAKSKIFMLFLIKFHK